MNKMPCNRKYPHYSHNWVSPRYGYEFLCKGVPGTVPSRQMTFPMTLPGVMERDEAESFAWPFYELILQRMEFRTGTFAEHADACMVVLDQLAAR